MICVYKIINTVTGDLYIGSTNDSIKRKSSHFNKLRKNKHHGCSVPTICYILKGRHSKTRKGVSFKYYENT